MHTLTHEAATSVMFNSSLRCSPSLMCIVLISATLMFHLFLLFALTHEQGKHVTSQSSAKPRDPPSGSAAAAPAAAVAKKRGGGAGDLLLSTASDDAEDDSFFDDMPRHDRSALTR